jgi:hypothetical protein
MTSSAVTASICASASEAALLVASLMPSLPRPGRDSSIAQEAQRRPLIVYSEHPTTSLAAMCPHATKLDKMNVRSVLRRQFGPLLLLLSRRPVSVVAARGLAARAPEQQGE